jgi:hypothetical protein
MNSHQSGVQYSRCVENLEPEPVPHRHVVFDRHDPLWGVGVLRQVLSRIMLERGAMAQVDGHWLRRLLLGLEHDSRGDSAGLYVGDRIVDLVKRSRLPDDACLAGGVEFEDLAQVVACADD